MLRWCVMQVAAALVVALPTAAGTGLAAQQPPVQTPPPAQAGKVAPAAPKPQVPSTPRVSIALTVTDLAGEAAPGVHVVLTGPVSREGTTDREGGLRFQTLRAGTYRLRFESPEFVTFEREVTVKTGPPFEVEVSLTRAPEKPAPPPPMQPVAATPPADAAHAAPDPNASVELLDLPGWIERNLIGRSDSQRESLVGNAPAAAARVLQVRDPIKDRVRADADEMLYVIAGEGVLRSKGRQYDLAAGSFAVVPRGVAYSIERRGRNPLIALSMMTK